jgi:hypothetical protein
VHVWSALSLPALVAGPPSPLASLPGRREIRGVVIVTPTPSAGTAVATGACDLKISLEVFDVSGSTISLSTDTSPIVPLVLTPSVK